MNISAIICAAFFTGLVLLACASRAEAFRIYAVDSSNGLLSFDSATPGIIQATTGITGLQSGESIRGIVIENDDWQTDPQQKQELEASGLQPSNLLEAAVVATIQPGQYTVQVRGKPDHRHRRGGDLFPSIKVDANALAKGTLHEIRI